VGVQASGYNVSNKNFSITKKLMCVHVQNQFLSVLGVETGLAGGTVGLTGAPDVQTGLTDTPTGITGPAVPV
jgi:hypothetical protein